MSNRPARGKIGDLNSPNHPFVSEGICRIDADVAACCRNQPVSFMYDFTRTLTRHQNAEHHWWATLTLLTTFLLAAFLVYQFWKDYEEKSKTTGTAQGGPRVVCESAHTPTRPHTVTTTRANMLLTPEHARDVFIHHVSSFLPPVRCVPMVATCLGPRYKKASYRANGGTVRAVQATCERWKSIVKGCPKCYGQSFCVFREM